MEFSAKRLRKYYKNMSRNKLWLRNLPNINRGHVRVSILGFKNSGQGLYAWVFFTSVQRQAMGRDDGKEAMVVKSG